MSNDSGSVFLALLTGAAIGAGVGILYAPEKGEKTRKKIKKKAIAAKEDISHRVSQATEELTKTAESKKADFERKLDETISTMSYKADDIIMTLEAKLAELKKKNAQLQKQPMAFDDIKESISDAEASARSYVKTSEEYYKLKGFKFLMKGITAFSKILVVGTVGILALLFLSLAASFGIGQALDNTFYGFLYVGGFYMVVGIILYSMRERLNRPLLKKFSEFYFDEL